MQPLLREEYLSSEQKKLRQQRKIEAYYKFQSRIYDLTRWSFLFGRDKAIEKIPTVDIGAKLLEVGCGTGYNLGKLSAKFPDCNIIGLDISDSMLKKAQRKYASNRKIELLKENFLSPYSSLSFKQVDLILFSYSLSMINPQWPEFVIQAKRCIKKGGYIAVVDFEDSKSLLFKRHMGDNHVRMDTHMKPMLTEQFETVSYQSFPAYSGLWSYFVFIGKKT